MTRHIEVRTSPDSEETSTDWVSPLMRGTTPTLTWWDHETLGPSWFLGYLDEDDEVQTAVFPGLESEADEVLEDARSWLEEALPDDD